MSKKFTPGKIILVLIVLIVIGAAGFGYFKQSAHLSDPAPAAEAAAAPELDANLLAAKPNDIIIGDANALVTIVEYSSLSCPHCAHFHETILPDIQKEFITTGKAKLVIRHFPLNDPALKGAELVECAGGNGLQRSNFVKVLFDMQQQWAFNDTFMRELKQIALVGGIDSATFESCMTDKDLEANIIASRQTAAEKLGVNSTPSFFINGAKMQGDVSIESFRKAIDAATAEPKE